MGANLGLPNRPKCQHTPTHPQWRVYVKPKHVSHLLPSLVLHIQEEMICVTDKPNLQGGDITTKLHQN